MKKITILLIVLISKSIFGQVEKSYIATYNYINVGLDVSESVNLYIEGNKSLTIFYNDTIKRKNDFDEEGNFNLNIEGSDKIGKKVYKNLKEKTIVFRDFYSKDGKLIPCIVEESLPNFEWIFDTKEKKIGSYLCKSAKLKFRGREYYVWYSTQIPISHGPWKFYGLPGLIMEVKSKDSKISFVLNKIKESNSLSDVIKTPKEGDKILFDDYIKYKENAVNDFIKNLYAKLPRGAKITVNSSNEDYNLEKEF
jgi:GLPGLI family protein